MIETAIILGGITVVAVFMASLVTGWPLVDAIERFVGVRS